MLVLGANYRVLIYCTCHFQVSSLCFSFFCLLVSSVSDFHADTKGAVVDTFLGSLVQSHCVEGGMLQTNNTGVCSQCLSHTGPVPTHGVCALPAHTAQALGCSTGNHPRPALGCMHLPGLSHSGSGTLAQRSWSPQRRRLGWACVLCPSQVWAAQETRCLASTVAVTYHLPRPYRSVFWLYNWRAYSGWCWLSKTPRSLS